MTVKELNAYLDSENYPARFKEIQRFIFSWEIVSKNGVILVENDPDDPGGATFAGLDKRSHPSLDFASLTPKAVVDEYLSKYWLKFGCEKYPAPLGEAFYNCCVNCGSGRANQILSLGVRTADNFLDEQENFYERLAQQKPKLRKFLKGWLNRTAALRTWIKEGR